MKTEWDYTELAEAYLKRPDYAQSAIDKMLAEAGIKKVMLHVMLERERHI